MSWPVTPYERLCCVTSTAKVLADAIDDDGTNTSNVLRLLVKELDAIKEEVCQAEERAEKAANDEATPLADVLAELAADLDMLSIAVDQHDDMPPTPEFIADRLGALARRADQATGAERSYAKVGARPGQKRAAKAVTA